MLTRVEVGTFAVGGYLTDLFELTHGSVATGSAYLLKSCCNVDVWLGDASASIKGSGAGTHLVVTKKGVSDVVGSVETAVIMMSSNCAGVDSVEDFDAYVTIDAIGPGTSGYGSETVCGLGMWSASDIVVSLSSL